ncbi:alpha-xylosidase [Bacillus sp. NPDC077027]|uniref:alpha-xylosidase n=1 Tax=Bacillus sp. NPDC077027 TaxID=3390548 RepID=UPI003D03C3A0
MKFSDGCWMTREGFHINSPHEVYDLKQREQELTLFAPFQHIGHKGATLDGGMLTIQLTSPLPNVIKVKLIHHKGGVVKAPAFELNEQEASLHVMEEDAHLIAKSGHLKAKIDQKHWGIQFLYGEKELVSSKGTGYVQSDEGQVYMKEELTIDVGELIYGLGERFTSFIKNGQTVECWNQDGGTGTEQAYKNVPFYLSNKGYGVFVNHPEHVSFEVGSEKVSRVQFSVIGEELEYFVIGGSTMKEVISHYTHLTGKPALPPAWSFGLWLSTSFLSNYDEETVTSFVDGMRERDIPLEVFHFDCLWMKEFEWCNFEWDERVFQNPQVMLKRLKEKGVHISVWINPYIAQKSPLFDVGLEKGYFLKKSDDRVWQWDKWQAGLAVVDFTNPEAVKWYTGHLDRLIEMGVDSFKTDFGERIPIDVVYHNGSDPHKMHNYYAYLYNKIVFEQLEKRLGLHEAVVFARSSTVGGQKFPVHWGGDSLSNYPSMAESLRGGLSFGLGGFGFWSHDIGGFENGTTPDLYKRWSQFGLLSSHSRYHGSGDYKVPWLYGEEAVEVTRSFTKLKLSLMPYLYRFAHEAVQSGVPMMRPMVLEFLDDETCHYLDRQYMLGSDLLIAPIFQESGEVSYYVPKGVWTNLLTNKRITGPGWQKEKHDYMTLPILVREHTVLPICHDATQASYDYTENTTFHLFEMNEGAASSIKIYHPNHKNSALFSAVKQNHQIIVKTEGIKGEYRIVLRNLKGRIDVDPTKASLVQEGLDTVIVTKEKTLVISCYI